MGDGGGGHGHDLDGGGASRRSLFPLTCHSLVDCSLPGLCPQRELPGRYCLESSSQFLVAELGQIISPMCSFFLFME